MSELPPRTVARNFAAWSCERRAGLPAEAAGVELAKLAGGEATIPFVATPERQRQSEAPARSCALTSPPVSGAGAGEAI